MSFKTDPTYIASTNQLTTFTRLSANPTNNYQQVFLNAVKDEKENKNFLDSIGTMWGKLSNMRDKSEKAVQPGQMLLSGWWGSSCNELRNVPCHANVAQQYGYSPVLKAERFMWTQQGILKFELYASSDSTRWLVVSPYGTPYIPGYTVENQQQATAFMNAVALQWSQDNVYPK